MDAVKAANLALRFLLELGAVVAVGYWGFKVSDGTIMKILLGIGAPVLVIALWASFVAPKAAVSLPVWAKVVLGLIILEAAAVALAFAGQTTVAIAFGAVVAINAVLLMIWGQ